MKYARKSVALFFAVVVVLSWACSASAAGGGEFTFVHITDVHVPGYGFPISQRLDDATLMPMHNQQRLRQLVDECLAMNPRPAFVANSGDTGDNGWTPLLRLYQRMMRPLVDAGIPVYTAAGNHDLDYAGIDERDLGEIFDPLGPDRIGRHGTRYSFDHRGCHIVFLNDRPISGLIRLDPADVTWLARDLRAVKKNTRVLVFLHANLPEEDTHHVAELLQTFRRPVIFQGHAHNESIGAWGNVPVVVTGSLYGGKPEAGSYRVVTVREDGIAVRTRDFASTDSAPGPETVVPFPEPGPRLDVVEPKEEAPVAGSIRLKTAVKPAAPGTMEYALPGIAKWTPMTGGSGAWSAEAPVPEIPGRYLVTFRFKGENGSVTLAHRVVRVSGGMVKEAWTRDLGSGMLGAPVIWRNLAILPTVEKGVFALRLEDGKQAWHRDDGTGRIPGRIALIGDTVYYGAGRTVHACDARTGKPLWQRQLGGAIIGGVVAGTGKLFAPAGEHALCCLDARSGAVLWEFAVRLPIIMEPSVEGNTVVFGAMDGFVRAVDATTGREIWANRVSSEADIYTTAPYWPPIFAGGRVIVCKNTVGRDDNNLMAFNASDGTTVWSHRLGVSPMRLATSAGKDTIYASVAQGGKRGISALSPADGATLWGRATGVGMSAGLASRGAIFARDDNSICLTDAAGGPVQWTYRASTGPQGSLYGPPAYTAGNGIAVIGTMDGKAIALRW